jgi:D-alanyl-D-alanine carboxypeptidase
MSIKYPVKDVVLPKDLKGAENGKLPESILKPIKIGGKMHHLAARAFDAMCAAAKADGITFSHVGDYRPYSQQMSMFKQRYTKGDSGDPRKITRTFNNEKWMLKKGFAPSSSPGTSNHGWGLAIDVALKVNGKLLAITSDPDGKGGFKDGVEWLLQHADAYGFSWEVREGSQAEAWHIRYYPGDKIPQVVLDFEASKNNS